MSNKNKLLREGRKYTFRDYFEMKHATEDIIIELGYGYEQSSLSLPTLDIESFSDLQDRLFQRLPKVILTSEAARREFYISPFLWRLIDNLDFRLRIEHPIEVNDYLRGILDYQLNSTSTTVVVEAKNADIDRGFTQLAVELIAVSQSIDNVPTHLYGAVTTGNLWLFGMLDIPNKVIYKDINEFLILQHMDKLANIFAGILSGIEHEETKK